MMSIVLLAFTAVMLAVHLCGRWLVRDMLHQPRKFWSARWLFRFEFGYYVALFAFCTQYHAGFSLWPVAVLGTTHMVGWVVAEYHPAMSRAIAWTPQLARLVDEIWIFDLAEVVFLVYFAFRCLV
ncbi:MAG: hypothetical protein HY645_09520 [Acidobacteria bacterium]|nr:hypothetical protein [Acidobacteriota bacterium]